jgi:ABC-type Zn2+ transport system substrate-binding protein/surface adhesin
MPRGEYDRSEVARASEYEHNRDPDYVAWRAERNRENCAIRVSRKTGDHRQHQEQAVATAMSEAISETIARTRREIVAELAAEQGKANPWKT